MIVAALAAGGCAPYATFPPIEVTGGLTAPTAEPFPVLMVEAIRHTAEGQTDFAYNLPAGATGRLYDEVKRRLGVGHPLIHATEPAHHVTVVRARGPKAEVDMIVPQPGGTHGLITVAFANRLGKGWVVVDERPWALQVEPPAPTWPEAQRLTTAQPAPRLP
jgi:hypothetical protein